MTFTDLYLEDQITVAARLDDTHGACVDIGELTVTAHDARHLATEVLIAASLAETAAARRSTR